MHQKNKGGVIMNIGNIYDQKEENVLEKYGRDIVKDVIDGKLVIGPEKEIQEVKTAYKAYEMIKESEDSWRYGFLNDGII